MENATGDMHVNKGHARWARPITVCQMILYFIRIILSLAANCPASR